MFLLWILAIATSLAVGYFTYRADVNRAAPLPWLTAALRTLLVFGVWLLIISPGITTRRTETRKPVIVLLQDESESIAGALGRDTATYRQIFEELKQRLSGKYLVVQRGFGTAVQSDSFYNYRQPATDIAAALQNVTNFFGAQNLGAVLLATDGRFNQGQHPLFAALPLTAPLYTIALGDTSIPRDVRVTAVYANQSVSLNSQFEIRADVVGQQVKGYNGEITLSENGRIIARQQVATPASGDRFDATAAFSVMADRPGFHRYVVSATVMDGEQNTRNNSRVVLVEVVEKETRILLAAAAPHPDISAIEAALKGAGRFKLSINYGQRLPDVSACDLLILHNLPTAPGQLASFNKPIWLIAGNGTNATALSGISLPASQVSPAPPHDVFAAANSGFSLFSLPRQTAAVLDKLPPLSTATGAATLQGGAQSLFNQRGGNQPLWAFYQNRPSSAVTLGEGLWRWRLYEYRFFQNHQVVDECIRQTVSFLAHDPNIKPWRVSLSKTAWNSGEPIILNGNLTNAAGQGVNTPDAAVIITDSAGKATKYHFDKEGNAYRLNLGIQPPGVYQYRATVNYEGKSYTEAGSFSVGIYSLEQSESNADFPLLYSLAQQYGGSAVTYRQAGSLYDTLARKNIQPVVDYYEEKAPLIDWKFYFLFILIIAVTEWLLRKYWLAQ